METVRCHNAGIKPTQIYCLSCASFRRKKIDNIIKGFLGKTINRVHHKSDEWTAFFSKIDYGGKQN